MRGCLSALSFVAVFVVVGPAVAQEAKSPPQADSRGVAEDPVGTSRERIRALSFGGESGPAAIESTADAINATPETRRAFGEVMRRFVAAYGPIRALKGNPQTEPPPEWLKDEVERLVFGPADRGRRARRENRGGRIRGSKNRWRRVHPDVPALRTGVDPPSRRVATARGDREGAVRVDRGVRADRPAGVGQYGRLRTRPRSASRRCGRFATS
jgi:hypothetical protein